MATKTCRDWETGEWVEVEVDPARAQFINVKGQDYYLSDATDRLAIEAAWSANAAQQRSDEAAADASKSERDAARSTIETALADPRKGTPEERAMWRLALDSAGPG